MSKRVIHTNKAPAAIGAYSQGIVSEGHLFTSGQIGLIPETGELAAGLEAQTEQVFANLEAICEAAGTSLTEAVKMTIVLKDINDFAVVNDAMLRHVPEPFPARSCFAVAALPKGALVEIEAVVELS